MHMREKQIDKGRERESSSSTKQIVVQLCKERRYKKEYIYIYISL